jgi:integrase
MATDNSTKTQKKIFIFGKRAIESLPTPATGKRAVYRDERNQYLFLRVTPTAKTFYWQQTIKGKQNTVTIAKFPAINSDQARDRAKEITADYVKGTDVQQEIRDTRQEMTLGELWEDYRVNRKRGQGRISEAYEYIYERHFSHWKTKRVSEISYDMARKLVLEIRPRAPVHANRVQRMGKALINHGIKELRLKVENPFLFSQVSEKGRSRKTYRLHRADMPAFMAALDTLPGNNMKDLFITSLFSGRRIGECRSMRWVDVDLQGGIWTIPDTKSGMSQTCVIPKPLVDILVDRSKLNIALKEPSIWIFPAHSKTGHVEAVNTAWELVRKETGFKHLQARDLRGTLASWLQEAGVPIAGASQQLGHADISTTATHYTTISDSLQRIGMDSAVAAMLEAAK